jgi:hypothetical protein
LVGFRWCAAHALFNEVENIMNTSLDADDSPLATVPQPHFAFGTPFDELPTQLTRRCCSGKSCTAILDRRAIPYLDEGSPTGASVSYAYVQNGTIFWTAATVDQLIVAVNEPDYWPVAD